MADLRGPPREEWADAIRALCMWNTIRETATEIADVPGVLSSLILSFNVPITILCDVYCSKR